MQIGHYDHEMLLNRRHKIPVITHSQGCIAITSLKDLGDRLDIFLSIFSTGAVCFDLEGIQHAAFGVDQDASISIFQVEGPVYPGGEPPQFRFIIYLSKLMADSLDFCIALQFSRFLFHPDRRIYWISEGAVNDMRRLKRFFGLPSIEYYLVEASEVWRNVGMMQQEGILERDPQ